MDVTEALKKAEYAKSYWVDIYTAMRDDIRFGIGLDHYTDTEIRRRGEDRCLVVPVLPQFIHQVVNDMRQNTPSINVLPGEGEHSDPETAKIFKGLIRNIEYKSNADEVYDTAGEYAVRAGLGFARVDHDYIGPQSFLQELKLCRVQNPLSTYLDPSYTQCDGSDAEWGFTLDPITRSEFEKKYPDNQFVSFDGNPTDAKAEEIVTAEFFWKTYEETEQQLNDDGTISDVVKDSGKPKRKLKKIIIRRARFSGAEELEGTTFPGIYVPIVPFLGEEVWVGGERHLLSLIRNAKDAQRRINKWATKESELLDMAPIAPVLAPVGAIEDVPDGWTRPDDTIVLRYKMYDSAGNKLDKPERLQAPQIPTGFVNAMAAANEQVKQAMGMYNASIGQRSNETSGVAIDARKVEGEVATFHFADNRNRSIQHIGRILVHAIPEIYDTERQIQIVGVEEEPELVGINGKRVADQKQDHDLTRGQYDVRVTTGASYTTKRQEGAALMGDAISKNPDLLKIIGDLWFKNLDIAGADAIASRIKKIIPPQLLDEKDRDQTAPDPEKQQMAQIIEQGAQELKRLQSELDNKQGELQLKGAEIQLKAQEMQIKAQQPSGTDPLDIAKLDLQKTKDDRDYQIQLAQLQLKQDELKLKGATETAKIKLDAEGFTYTESPERVARDGEQAMMDAQAGETKAALEQEKLELKAADIALRAEQGDALLSSLAQINNTLAIIAQPKPIAVIRNENGLITGAV